MTTPPPPRLVDSHCHLDFPDFQGQLPEVIAGRGRYRGDADGDDLHAPAERTRRSRDRRGA